MKRARDEADRDRRRGAILAAAGALLRRGDGTLPSVAAIASEAALAKGTVYLYFDTKEEILLALMRQLWEPVFAALAKELGAVDRPLGARIATFAEGFARYCRENEHLLRLDAILKEVIERNVDARRLSEYRDGIVLALTATGDRLDDALVLTPGKGFRIALGLHALMRGLWQSFGEPVPGRLGWTFEDEIREATTEYLRGALADGSGAMPGP